MGIYGVVFSYAGAVTAISALAIWWVVSDLLEEKRANRRRKEWQELVARMRVEPRQWRAPDLLEYNGQDPQKPLLIGVDGEVFNVWRGRDFYGAGGPYGSFAGRDATRLLAKYIVDDAEDDGEPLTAEELDTLQSWKEPSFRVRAADADEGAAAGASGGRSSSWSPEGPAVPYADEEVRRPRRPRLARERSCGHARLQPHVRRPVRRECRGGRQGEEVREVEAPQEPAARRGQGRQGVQEGREGGLQGGGGRVAEARGPGASAGRKRGHRGAGRRDHRGLRPRGRGGGGALRRRGRRRRPLFPCAGRGDARAKGSTKTKAKDKAKAKGSQAAPEPSWDPSSFKGKPRPLQCGSIWDIPTSRFPEPEARPPPKAKKPSASERDAPKLATSGGARAPVQEGGERCHCRCHIL
ncbi:unnamed protein product [Prorocentrum cordatum]|uniref:Cytochrome b5 heme-binding domain-containing protein n=1 Tax=Prorocentrum cordatum TaxID=2364126 RepID=A0ABN9YKY5_9DINO|nr:unnamed protein product [Polarella glacialis]